jgi:formylglycine-generating enzyme required for sulfatase activity
MRHGVVAALIFVAGASEVSRADDKKPIVAVFKIENKGTALKAGVLERLTIYLASKLSESGEYEVVPQDKLKEALTAKKKESYKGCYDQSCQIDVGKELAADKALSTQVMKVGTKCMVTCNLYDLKKSTSGRAATAEGKCTEDGINTSLKQAAAKLTAKSTPPPPLPAPSPTPSPAPAPSPAPTPSPARAGNAITNAKDGSVMVLVPAGSFLRGSAEGQGSANERPQKSIDERPQKSIHLDTFYIDKHEVSVARYRKCVQAGGCTTPNTRNCNWGESGREDHPVNCVDWEQARKYCAWAGGRLPSEAEWEKAARGTDGREYPWGSERATCERAVLTEGGAGCGKGRTWPVGSKAAGDSPCGAQDMAGNVWEWVNDWYDKDYYRSSPARNPAGASSGTFRVIRGGSWNYFAENLRAAYRTSAAPAARGIHLGFRCVRTKRP